MELKIRKNGDVYIIDVTGEMDLYNSYKLKELVMKMPHLRIAWYAIERHYQDARKRAKYPEMLDLCYMGFIDNEPDMARAINNTNNL